MLNFKEWKIWYNSKAFTTKWFVVLVLLRPIIDNFYFLKNVSPLLSPLYLVGVLTPLLVFHTFNKTKKGANSVIDSSFFLLTACTLLSTFMVFLYDPVSIEGLQFIVKLPMIIYLFYYCRRIVTSKEDLERLMQTFIYSTFFVVVILLYEVIVNPFKVEYSRGLERIQGNFADVTNYGFYATISFLCITYFFMKSKKTASSEQRFSWLLGSVAFSALVLFKINHTASWGVFIALSVLFAFYTIRINKVGGLLFIFFVGVVGYVYFADTINAKIAPLIETDLMVLNGEKDEGRLFHGRMSRWDGMLDEFSNFSPAAQFLGMPMNFEYSFHYIGTGSHNDFLRMLFFTGYIGLLAYIIFLINILIKVRYFETLQQYVVYGIAIVICLYSITTNPTFYAPVMYIALPIFAFVALPKSSRR